MHHPALDPSARQPAPSPDYTFGEMLAVDALVLSGILGLLAIVSYPAIFVGFAVGVLLARSNHRLRDLGTRVRDRMVGRARRQRGRPSARSDSTLMGP